MNSPLNPPDALPVATRLVFFWLYDRDFCYPGLVEEIEIELKRVRKLPEIEQEIELFLRNWK